VGCGTAGRHKYAHAPSFDLKDAEVRLVDVDGDGVPDAIRSGTRLECYFNDRFLGWNGTRQIERGALDEFPESTSPTRGRSGQT
jgi:hypothetical protein